MGENCGVICRVHRRVLNESDEVIDDVLLVVRNDREDLGDYLTEFRNMQVYGLVRDAL